MNEMLHKNVLIDRKDGYGGSSVQEKNEIKELATMLRERDEYDEDLQRKYEKVSSSCGTNKE